MRLRWWLADAHNSRHDAPQAAALCEEALAIQRRHLGPLHPEIAETLVRRARALGEDLKWPQAEQVLREVVEMRVRLHGENHPATADALMSLAVQVDHQFKREESIAVTGRALAIYRRTLGPAHPSTLRALRNLALNYRRMGRFGEAERYYRESLEACVRTLGEQHPSTIQALLGLQNLRLDQGRPEDARDLGVRIIRAYERIAARGDAEPDVLDDYANYLLTAQPSELRNPQRAAEVARRAVNATGRRDHLTLRTLGLAQRDLGQPREAVATLREALSLPQGTRSWTTEEALVALMETHAPAEVEPFLLGFLDRQRALRGSDDQFIAKTLRLLALHDRKAGRTEEAEKRARATLTQLRKTLPESYWEVGRAKLELGEILTERRAFASAESLLLQGYETLEADRETGPGPLGQARDRVVRLYERWGRPGEARAWRERRLRPTP